MSKKITYFEFYNLWKVANPTTSSTNGKKIQEECNTIWKTIKKDPLLLQREFEDLQKKKIRMTKPTGLREFLYKKKVVASTDTGTSNKDIQILSAEISASHMSTSVIPGCSTSENGVCTSIPSDSVAVASKRECSVQKSLEKEIANINSQLDSYKTIKLTRVGLTEPQIEEEKHLRKLKPTLQKRLKKLQANRVAVAAARQRRRATLQRLQDRYPEIAQDFKEVRPRKSAGRPRLEEKQPQLLSTIVDIVSTLCIGQAHERRRCELLRAIMTLDDLHSALKDKGYDLSRQALYTRLLPRRSDTAEGRRHVVTVPVRLLRARNDARKKHIDSHFAAASVCHLKELAEMFGENTVFMVGQDDKARVPLGLAAANKQSPILMHVDYRVRLPDHDWVVAPKHKLIPSVYAGLAFSKNKLSYSGPTYIAIRSGKHDKSAPNTHREDLSTLPDRPAFRQLCNRKDDTTKPIWIILVDGSTDGNPRYPKQMAECVKLFKTNDLDALFMACYAPGQSAFNPTERRMAPLSRDLCGVIIPHDVCGSHLDANGKTVNFELESENFRKAGQILADVWNGTKIDGFEVVAEFKESEEGRTETPGPTEIWKVHHIRQSQYLLQIRKCNNSSCCSPSRCNINEFLIDRFLPPPVKYSRNSSGIAMTDVREECGSFDSLSRRLALKTLEPKLQNFDSLPYDFYCPSVHDKLSKQICKTCHLYFPSQSAMKHHVVVHKAVASSNETVDELEFTIEEVPMTVETDDINDMIVIGDRLEEWYAPQFETEDRNEQMPID